MASVTLTVDPELLEAARIEAERRNTSLDQMVSEYFASFPYEKERADATRSLEREENRRLLLEHMDQGVLGDLGKLPTREEIYAERTRWPRS